MKGRFTVIIALIAATACNCWGESGAPQPVAVKQITAVALVCPTASEEARQSYNHAQELQQLGRLRDAEASYLKAIELDPGYCDAMDNLGQMLRSQGKVDQAIGWYQRSISVKPDDTVAHQNLAAAYMFAGAPDNAVPEYLWLIEHEPDNPEGYYGLGNAHKSMGRPKDAIAPLERAESLYSRSGSPLLADAQYELGVAYYMMKEHGRGAAYLQKVYAERGSDPTLNYLLGACYLVIPGEAERARGYLLKAKKLGVDVLLYAKSLGDTIPEPLRRELGD